LSNSLSIFEIVNATRDFAISLRRQRPSLLRLVVP
jgi:hypothetical protein